MQTRPSSHTHLLVEESCVKLILFSLLWFLNCVRANDSLEYNLHFTSSQTFVSFSSIGIFSAHIALIIDNLEKVKFVLSEIK